MSVEEKILRDIAAHLGVPGYGRAAAPATAAGGGVATDAELDGQYSDPEVKKDPPRWKGAPVAPCKMSAGPPDWLLVLADFKDWQAVQAAEKNEVTDKGKPIADFRRKDAALARGWARRNANGAPATAADPTAGW